MKLYFLCLAGTSAVNLTETSYEPVGQRQQVLPAVYDRVNPLPVYNNVNQTNVQNTDIQNVTYEDLTTA